MATRKRYLPYPAVLSARRAWRVGASHRQCRPKNDLPLFPCWQLCILGRGPHNVWEGQHLNIQYYIHRETEKAYSYYRNCIINICEIVISHEPNFITSKDIINVTNAIKLFTLQFASRSVWSYTENYCAVHPKAELRVHVIPFHQFAQNYHVRINMVIEHSWYDSFHNHEQILWKKQHFSSRRNLAKNLRKWHIQDVWIYGIVSL